MNKPSILFMGTPEFARVSLVSLIDNGYPIVGVFTQPDKPAGRGRHLHVCPTAELARGKSLPLFQPETLKDEGILKQIESLKPDFIVVSAYGKILPKQVLEAVKIDCVNVHASLLPKYRGAAPIPWVLINGETETGASIMKLILKLDAGPVYRQTKIPIEGSDTAGSLAEKLAPLGARLLLETLPKIQSGQITPTPQDDSKATLAPALKKEDGKIDWRTSASEIANRIRGLNPWPGAYTFIDNKMLKIYHGQVLAEKTDKAPGTVYFLNEKGIHVSCGEGAIVLTEVQLEGKRCLPASEFVRGYRLEVGKRLGM
ncbi:MAG: methionyl-tRNA formyltransferase [Deltaproteobacteria bacterium]|nr:methionyl-tRNA formyltransferase [Deltaproteobacteria bacterium]